MNHARFFDKEIKNGGRETGASIEIDVMLGDPPPPPPGYTVRSENVFFFVVVCVKVYSNNYMYFSCRFKISDNGKHGLDLF